MSPLPPGQFSRVLNPSFAAPRTARRDAHVIAFVLAELSRKVSAAGDAESYLCDKATDFAIFAPAIQDLVLRARSSADRGAR